MWNGYKFTCTTGRSHTNIAQKRLYKRIFREYATVLGFTLKLKLHADAFPAHCLFPKGNWHQWCAIDLLLDFDLIAPNRIGRHTMAKDIHRKKLFIIFCKKCFKASNLTGCARVQHPPIHKLARLNLRKRILRSALQIPAATQRTQLI